MERTGLLITCEGLGGSGKSTLARRLVDWLSAAGVPVIATREPGGTELGRALRRLLLSSSPPPAGWTEAFLFEADRAQTYVDVIIPAISAGKVVVSDRNVYGTIAYQAFGRRLDLDLIDRMNRVATYGQWPDLILLLDIDPSLGVQRKHGQQAADRFDEEDMEFQRRVRDGYRFAAQRDSGIAHILDGAQPADTVFHQARQLVSHRLNPLFPELA